MIEVDDLKAYFDNHSTVKIYVDVDPASFDGVHSPSRINLRNTDLVIVVRYPGYSPDELNEYEIHYWER